MVALAGFIGFPVWKGSVGLSPRICHQILLSTLINLHISAIVALTAFIRFPVHVSAYLSNFHAAPTLKSLFSITKLYIHLLSYRITFPFSPFISNGYYPSSEAANHSNKTKPECTNALQCSLNMLIRLRHVTLHNWPYIKVVTGK